MPIPRHYHFIFGLRPQTSSFHIVHYLCLRSCLEVNQPDAVVFHYKHEPWGPLWDEIKPKLRLRQWKGDIPDLAYSSGGNEREAEFRYAHEADFIRLEILEREGGVYADMDSIFVRPMPNRMFEYRCVMGHEAVDRNAEQNAQGSLCNALIMAEAGSEFLGAWRTKMTEWFDGSWSRHSTFLPYKLSRQFPEWIDVEPKDSFFHLDWTREGIRQLFEADEELPPTVYSLHLWAHLWWSRSRLDFSHFHEGRLTPAYFHHAQTTYAKLSRRFLPLGMNDPGSSRLWTENAVDWASITWDRLQGASRRKSFGSQ